MEADTPLVRDHGSPDYPPRLFNLRRHSIRYSDINFRLLIAIIEAVMGQPLQDAYEALIFRPLGLSRTFFPGSPPPPRRAGSTLDPALCARHTCTEFLTSKEAA